MPPAIIFVMGMTCRTIVMIGTNEGREAGPGPQRGNQGGRHPLFGDLGSPGRVVDRRSCQPPLGCIVLLRRRGVRTLVHFLYVVPDSLRKEEASSYRAPHLYMVVLISNSVADALRAIRAVVHYCAIIALSCP